MIFRLSLKKGKIKNRSRTLYLRHSSGHCIKYRRNYRTLFLFIYIVYVIKLFPIFFFGQCSILLYFFHDYISFGSPLPSPSPGPNLPVPLNFTATVYDFIAIRAFTLITTKMVFRTMPPVFVIDRGRSFFSDSIDNLRVCTYIGLIFVFGAVIIHLS